MKNAMQLAAVVAVLAIAASALATQGVSPGAVDRLAQVNNPCPTFSWVESEDAERYELVAYALPEDPAEPVELRAGTEVLYAAVPAGATSWTPSADQCVAPGGRYVWFVRAATETAVDQVIEAGEWSEGRYFQVPAVPSDDEVARAIEVLERWQTANGSRLRTLSSATATATATDAAWDRRAPARHHASRSSAGKRSGSGINADAGTGAGSAAPKSVPTAPAAIRGEHPATTGEVYGLVGISASLTGAGVAAVNLDMDGGPDLVLDGSVNGQADALLTEAWMDRPSTDDETFGFRNSGGGTMDVIVEGRIVADKMKSDEVVVSGTTLLDASGDWLSNGSTVPCAGCVASADIADGSVGSADLAGGAVTGSKISTGAVDTGALRNGAVTTAKIADGTITAADIDPAGGVYATKSATYGEYDNVVLQPGDCLQLTVSCRDDNDLPLQGKCSAAIGDIELMHTVGTYPIFWDSMGNPAGWTCHFCYDPSAVNVGTVESGIICIEVP